MLDFEIWEKMNYIPEVTCSFLKFSYQIPCLIFIISLLLLLFVSASEITYSLWSHVATVYIFQALSYYCMKSTVVSWLLNMLHNHMQHTTSIYISACVIWHKGTYVYISYCQPQQVRQKNCSKWLILTKLTQFIPTVCSVRTGIYMNIPPMAADIQPKRDISVQVTCA